MEYLVTAKFMDRVEESQARTANDAYAAGLEYERRNAVNVTITAPTGKFLTVAEFWRALSTGKPV